MMERASGSLPFRLPMPWDRFLAACGVCFLALLWVFGAMGFDAGVYGLLFLTCVGIVLLSVMDLGWALVAGMFAVPLLSIQFLLPWNRVNIAFDKVFIVVFSLVWAARRLRPETIRRYLWEWRIGFAWLVVLVLLATSAAVSWTRGNGISPLDILEPCLSALFFVAAFDVLSREKKLFSRLVWALVLSGSLVLLGAAAQVVSESVGIRPPWLAFMAEMDKPPFLPLFSTIAHPNYFAAFVGFLMPLAIGFLASVSPRHDWHVCTWVVVCGLVAVVISRSLAGMFILTLIVLLSYLLMDLPLSLRRILGTGILVLVAGVLLWGIPKLQKGISYSLRTYVYKVVIPEIQEKLLLGSGPGSFARVFRERELAINPDDRFKWRRTISGTMLRDILRPGSNMEISTAGNEGEVWLEYDMSKLLWTMDEKRRPNLLEGISASTRVKAENPGRVRLFISDGERRFFSPFHKMKGGEDVLTAQVPYRIRGYEGWRMASADSGLSVVPVLGRRGKNLSAIRLRDAPLNMRFSLKRLLRGNLDLVSGKEVAAGAWIKTDAIGIQETEGKVRLQLAGERESYFRHYYLSDGGWQFHWISGKLEAGEKEFFLDVTVDKEGLPVQIDGIFFDDGESLVRLTPGEDQLPPPAWAAHARPVLSLGEYEKRIGGEIVGALRSRGGPHEFRFFLDDLVEEAPVAPEGRKVSAGAWVRVGRANRPDLARDVRLRLVALPNQQYSEFHRGDGEWQFLSVNMVLMPGWKSLPLNLEALKGKGVVELDGIFFKDGEFIVKLMPGGRRLPPPGWAAGKEVISRSEFAYRFKREIASPLLLYGAPRLLEFGVGDLWKGRTRPSRGRLVAVGAWVRVGGESRSGGIPRAKLRLGIGPKSYENWLLAEEGGWEFLATKGEIEPDSGALRLTFEFGDGASAVEIGGLYFDDGELLVSLIPSGRRAPPIEFSRSPQHARKVLSLGEYTEKSSRRERIAGPEFRWAAISRFFIGLFSAPSSGPDIPFLDQLPNLAGVGDGSNVLALKSFLGSWRAGLQVAPGSGTVHFDRLSFDFSGKATAHSSSWKEDPRKASSSGNSGNGILPGWTLRIDNWGQNVDPNLSAHSTYLLILVERGLLGFLAFAVLLGILGREVFFSWKTDRSGWSVSLSLALMALLVSSTVEDTLAILRFNLLFWAVAAAVLSRTYPKTYLAPS